MFGTDYLDSAPPVPATRPGFTPWPLWATAAGVLGLVSLLSQTRVDADGAAHGGPATADAVAELGNASFRVAGILGYLAAFCLLVLAAMWHQRVARHFPSSAAAHLVTYSVVSASALATLAFGWRAALGDYLPGGAEAGSYDDHGLFVYYVLNDFSPYLAFVPLLGTCFGLAWMAFGDRLVSLTLGAAAGAFATVMFIGVALTGVSSLPTLVLAALVVVGIWLAVGRSPITTEWPN